MTEPIDLETAPPVEFDTALADRFGEKNTAMVKADRAWSTVSHLVKSVLGRGYRDPDPTVDEVKAQVAKAREVFAAGDPGHEDREAWSAWYAAKGLVEAADKYEAAVEAVHAIVKRIGAYDEAFKARGGWTRAYLVTNTGGHVHSSMDCSTCFYSRVDKYGHFKPGTQYAWLPELSGHDEAEIIAAAGSDACTVCYPNAPVNDLKRPRSIFTADERSAAERKAEAEAKRDAKEAAKVTLTVWDSGRGLRDKSLRQREVTWKTVRALQNDTGALARNLTGSWAMVNGFDLELTEYNGVGRVPVNRDEALHNLRVMVEALNERGVDGAVVVAKNHKRAVKEGGTQWDGVL